MNYYKKINALTKIVINEQIKACFKLLPAAIYISVHEVKLRYRKSILGPLWLTISNAVYIIALGLLWSNLIGNSGGGFFKYFALSQLFWVWISSQISESCETYLRNERLVCQLTIPLQFYVIKDMLKNVFVFLHNIIIVVAICIIFPSDDLRYVIDYIFVIPVALLFIYSISSIIAIACMRYRDLTPIITTGMQLAYFITPIVWMTDRLGLGKSWVYEFNPFYHLIRLLRDPLLGLPIAVESFLALFFISIVCLLFSNFLYKKYSKKIYFWY